MNLKGNINLIFQVYVTVYNNTQELATRQRSTHITRKYVILL